jgi:hypothetical protein
VDPRRVAAPFPGFTEYVRKGLPVEGKLTAYNPVVVEPKVSYVELPVPMSVSAPFAGLTEEVPPSMSPA